MRNKGIQLIVIFINVILTAAQFDLILCVTGVRVCSFRTPGFFLVQLSIDQITIKKRGATLK